MKQKIKGTKDRPRLSVFRSNRNIFAQVIDDSTNTVLTGASSLSKDIRTKKIDKPIEISKAVGRLLAERALGKAVKKVKFDKRHYKYHGNIKELADGAREGGLEF